MGGGHAVTDGKHKPPRHPVKLPRAEYLIAVTLVFVVLLMGWLRRARSVGQSYHDGLAKARLQHMAQALVSSRIIDCKFVSSGVHHID
jgi:hypothetical protein